MLSLQKRLKKHLLATDGNLGRTGREVKTLARLSGISVSMIQSVARGSRKFSDTSADVMDTALTPLEDLQKLYRAHMGRRRG